MRDIDERNGAGQGNQANPGDALPKIEMTSSRHPGAAAAGEMVGGEPCSAALALAGAGPHGRDGLAGARSRPSRLQMRTRSTVSSGRCSSAPSSARTPPIRIPEPTAMTITGTSAFRLKNVARSRRPWAVPSTPSSTVGPGQRHAEGLRSHQGSWEEAINRGTRWPGKRSFHARASSGTREFIR